MAASAVWGGRGPVTLFWASPPRLGRRVVHSRRGRRLGCWARGDGPGGGAPPRTCPRSAPGLPCSAQGGPGSRSQMCEGAVACARERGFSSEVFSVRFPQTAGARSSQGLRQAWEAAGTLRPLDLAFDQQGRTGGGAGRSCLCLQWPPGCPAHGLRAPTSSEPPPAGHPSTHPVDGKWSRGSAVAFGGASAGSDLASLPCAL